MSLIDLFTIHVFCSFCSRYMIDVLNVEPNYAIQGNVGVCEKKCVRVICNYV